MVYFFQNINFEKKKETTIIKHAELPSMQRVMDNAVKHIYMYTYHIKDDYLFVCLIWFFTSHQQSFSYTGMGLPGLNQY